MGCSRALRDAVTDVVHRMHFITVRGSYIANAILADVVRNNLVDLPDVTSTTFWCQIFKSAGQPTVPDAVAGRQRCKWDERITQTAWRLFGSAEPISNLKLTCFVSWLAKDAIPNVRAMVTLNFTTQVENGFMREVRLWKLSQGTPIMKGSEAEAHRLRCKVVNWAARECLEHEFRLSYPPEAPPQLMTALLAIIGSWNSSHTAVMPCPTSEFASNKRRFAALYRWMLELQIHRVECVQRATQHLQGNLLEARELLGVSAKAFRPLPVASRKIKHIVLDKSCLRVLLIGMDGVERSEIPCLRPLDAEDQISEADLAAKATKREARLLAHPEEREIQRRPRNTRSAESMQREDDKFWGHFPGAAALLRGAGGRKGATLHPLLRTDGVAVSVAIRKPGSSSHLSGKALLNLKDLDDGNPIPLQPQPQQRFVSIDPGRRDMIFAHIEDYGPRDPVTGEYGVTSSFDYKVSTRRMARECGTKRTANVTLSTLKGVYVTLPNSESAEAEHVSLLAALENLPSSREFETWSRHEAAAIPLLDTALRTMQRKVIQKATFDGYKARDAALDRVCKDLCRGKPVAAEPLPKHALEKRFTPFQPRASSRLHGWAVAVSPSCSFFFFCCPSFCCSSRCR